MTFSDRFHVTLDPPVLSNIFYIYSLFFGEFLCIQSMYYIALLLSSLCNLINIFCLYMKIYNIDIHNSNLIYIILYMKYSFLHSFYSSLNLYSLYSSLFHSLYSFCLHSLYSSLLNSLYSFLLHSLYSSFLHSLYSSLLHSLYSSLHHFL